jgi:multiple sugar transport system permease protein
MTDLVNPPPPETEDSAPSSDRSQRRFGRRRRGGGGRDQSSLVGHHWAAPYLLSGPAVFMVLALLAFPVVYAMWGSLFETETIGGEPEWVGFEHYIELFSEPDFLWSINRTVVFVAGCLVLGISLSVAFAFALNKALGGLRFLRGLTILPYVVSGVAAAVMFRLLFNQDFGWVNRVLGLVGIDGPGWFVSPTLAMIAVIIAQVWTDLPLAVLLILGGLQTVDPNLLDAADVDGATGWTRAWRISIPLVTPQIVLATVWFSYSTLTSLGVVLALTGGGPLDATQTLPVTLYETAFRNFEIYRALAIVVIVLIFNALLTLLYVAAGRRYDLGD